MYTFFFLTFIASVHSQLQDYFALTFSTGFRSINPSESHNFSIPCQRDFDLQTTVFYVSFPDNLDSNSSSIGLDVTVEISGGTNRQTFKNMRVFTYNFFGPIDFTVTQSTGVNVPDLEYTVQISFQRSGKNPPGDATYYVGGRHRRSSSSASKKRYKKWNKKYKKKKYKKRPWKKNTNRPTNRPTRRPWTNQPTRRPTNKPTMLTNTDTPSKIQTSNPTSNPSQNPTKNPSQHPTRSPTQSPTKIPTRNPTKNPTNNPTRTPSQNPTKNPTQNPVQPPSSKNPTTFPTAGPTQRQQTRSPTTTRSFPLFQTLYNFMPINLTTRSSLLLKNLKFCTLQNYPGNAVSLGINVTTIHDVNFIITPGYDVWICNTETACTNVSQVVSRTKDFRPSFSFAIPTAGLNLNNFFMRVTPLLLSRRASDLTNFDVLHVQISMSLIYHPHTACVSGTGSAGGSATPLSVSGGNTMENGDIVVIILSVLCGCLGILVCILAQYIRRLKQAPVSNNLRQSLLDGM